MENNLREFLEECTKESNSWSGLTCFKAEKLYAIIRIQDEAFLDVAGSTDMEIYLNNKISSILKGGGK